MNVAIGDLVQHRISGRVALVRQIHSLEDGTVGVCVGIDYDDIWWP